MTGHFYKNANVHDLILTKRPKVILEVGCHIGDMTRILASLVNVVPCEVISISDRPLAQEVPEVDFRVGISYEEIKNLDDDSIGMAIIDTDHNYWTLQKELLALIPKIEEGGLVVMHDVEEFYYDTGMADAYWNDAPYPTDEILKMSGLGGLGLCLIDFLHTYRGTFKLVRWVPEHHGCAVIEKKSVTATQVIRPGSDSKVAPPKKP